jgi:hypothetical protein
MGCTHAVPVVSAGHSTVTSVVIADRLGLVRAAHTVLLSRAKLLLIHVNPRDRCLWAGALFLARRSTEETALKSVRIALRDEGRWRAQGSLESSA